MCVCVKEFLYVVCVKESLYVVCVKEFLCVLRNACVCMCVLKNSCMLYVKKSLSVLYVSPLDDITRNPYVVIVLYTIPPA